MKKLIAIIAVVATMPVSALAGHVKLDEKAKGAISCGLRFKTEKSAEHQVKKTDKASLAR